MEFLKNYVYKMIFYILQVFQQVFVPYLNHSTMSCMVHALQPRSRGTVRLQSSNPYDSPIIDPNYLADARDADDIVEGMIYRLYIHHVVN